MNYTTPDEEDFVIEDSKVAHTPSGAWFTYHHIEGGFSFNTSSHGSTDRPNPNGVSYSFEQLQAMACKLFKAKHLGIIHSTLSKRLSLMLCPIAKSVKAR